MGIYRDQPKRNDHATLVDLICNTLIQCLFLYIFLDFVTMLNKLGAALRAKV